MKLTSQHPVRRRSAGAAIALSALLAVTACGGDEAEAPAEPAPVAAETATTPAAEWPAGDEKGTLSNPYSLGEEMVDGDFTLTVNSVNLDGNEQFKAMDSFLGKVEPDPGNTWVFINATWGYTGDEPADNVGTDFSIVNENWDGGFMTDDEYGTTFNSVSALKEGETKAEPVEKGFTVTADAVLQMPIEHANTSSMVKVNFNHGGANDFLVALK